MRKVSFFVSIFLISSFLFSCSENSNETAQSEGASYSQVQETVDSSSQVQETKLAPIAHQYDRAEDFSEGLAAVCIDDKLGYIDKTGEIVIPLKYEWIGYLGTMRGIRTSAFTDGLAVVCQNGKYGFVDKTGKEIVPCKYDDAFIFAEGMAAVKLGTKWGFIDTTGREVVPPKYDRVSSFSEGMAAVANGGELYIPPEDELGEVEYINSKWGFIDKTGTEVIPCQYSYVEKFRFQEGVAIVITEQGNFKIIDKTGKDVVPEGKYSTFGDVSEGLVAASVGSQWGFLDLSGNEVIPCVNEYAISGIIPSFSEGLAWFKMDHGKYGVIDKSGKIIVQPIYYDEIWYFKEGMSRVKVNGKYGFINKNGILVINPKYGWAFSFIEGMARVCMNSDQVGEWGFIDKTGREITPLHYFSAYDFNEGYAAVNIGDSETGKWGFIDKEGNTVVECKYSEVSSYKEGMAAVCLDGKWGYIPYP